MSYSFTVKGKGRAEVQAAAAAYFDEKVVAQQPGHARDRDAVLRNLDELLGQFPPPPEGKEIRAALSGYLSWVNGPDGAYNHTTGISMSCALAVRDPGDPL